MRTIKVNLEMDMSLEKPVLFILL